MSKKILNVRTALAALLLVVALFYSVSANPKAAEAACTAPATTYGTDTMTVSAPSAGTYYLWVRMEDPSTTANSIMLQVDTGTCFTVGDSTSIPASTWTWVNYQAGTTTNVMKTTLTQGTHTLELIGTDKGVSVDRIELLTDASCTPTSTGENCAPSNVAPPTVSFTAPTQSATVKGSVAVTATAASATGVTQVGIAHVVLEEGSTILATLSASPYTTTWNTTTVANGTYTLHAVATDTQGNQTTTPETVTVDNTSACAASPAAPTALKTTATTDNSVTLSWTAPTPPTGCTITKYNVNEVSTNGSTVVSSPTTNSATITGLIPDTKYVYTVSAADSIGTSAASTSFTATTAADTTAPSAPTSARATAVASSEVHLTWTEPTSTEAVSYYRIYRNGTLLPLTSTTTSYTDSTVAANTTYTYTISAVSSSDVESAKAATTPASVTTPKTSDTTPPSAPAGLKETLVSSSSVALSWTASSDNVAVAGYKIYRNGTLISGTGLVTGTSYTDSSVSASTAYTYYVVAVDSSNNVSSDSNTLNVTTLAGNTTGSCSPDLNSDGVVDIYDASIMFSHWAATNATCAEGDLNSDKVVNIYDASIMFSAWGDKE